MNSLSRSILSRFGRKTKNCSLATNRCGAPVRGVHLRKHEAENDIKGFTLVSILADQFADQSSLAESSLVQGD